MLEFYALLRDEAKFLGEIGEIERERERERVRGER